LLALHSKSHLSSSQALGYRGEIGYNQLLYPSDADVRAISSFLIDKLPKAEAADDEQAEDSASHMLEREISRAVSGWVKQPWTAPAVARSCQSPLESTPLVSPFAKPGSGPARAQYVAQHQHLVSAQAPSLPVLLVTLQEASTATAESARLSAMDASQAGIDGISALLQARKVAISAAVRSAFQSGGGSSSAGGGLASSASLSLAQLAERIRLGAAASAASLSAFKAKAEMTQETVRDAGEDVSAAAAASDAAGQKSDEELAAEREAQLAQLNGQLAEILAATVALEQEAAEASSSAEQLGASLMAVKSDVTELETKLRRAKDTLVMLPEADSIITSLQGECGQVADVLIELAAEWEGTRRPLLESIRAYKASVSDRKKRAEGLLQEMNALQAGMGQLTADIKAREATVAQLSAEYEALPKEHIRGEYTKRIFEIVQEVRKQQIGISTVLSDIRNLQRAVNASEEKLGRTTQSTEALLFEAANSKGKQQPTHLQAYSNMAALQELWHETRRVSQAAADADNEQRAVQTRIDDLKRHVDPARTAQVKSDLAAVKAENKALQAQVAAAGL